MTDETNDTKPTASTPPARGEFCHRHFSWLCQAGQGKCQRGEGQQ